MTSPPDETADILAILGAEVPELDDGFINIPELGIATRARGDLAAFWDGYRDGQRGHPRKVRPDYDEPSVYRRAHACGVVSRKDLT